jgi:hypothetical protein
VQRHPTPMIESSCNLDFDFTGALAGRGWPCLLSLIVNELHGETRPICLSLPTRRAVGDLGLQTRLRRATCGQADMIESKLKTNGGSEPRIISFDVRQWTTSNGGRREVGR